VSYDYITGARICSASRVALTGSDNVAVTGWIPGTDFILAVHFATDLAPVDSGHRLQWRNASDSGAWGYLGSTGELTYLADTVLVNGDVCTPPNTNDWRCTEQGVGKTNNPGTERENSNAAISTYWSSDDETEHQWAISTDNAHFGDKYEFRMIDTWNSDRVLDINLYLRTYAKLTLGLDADLIYRRFNTTSMDAILYESGPKNYFKLRLKKPGDGLPYLVPLQQS